MSKVLDLVQELVEELKAEQDKRTLNAQEKRTLDRLGYHLKAAGVKLGDSRKTSQGSELAKKFSQGAKNKVKPLERFEGVNKLQASKLANEEAQKDPKAVEQDLEEAELESEVELETEELDEIILANSEEKPQPKKRGRKKKTDDE